MGPIYQPKDHVYDSNWNIFLVINEAHRNKHGYIQKMSMENVDILVFLWYSNNKVVCNCPDDKMAASVFYEKRR